MDTYKDVFYSAGLPALISTGITLVYFILKAYQFAVHAVSHQTKGRLAAATPSGRKQKHGSIEGEQGHTQVPGGQLHLNKQQIFVSCAIAKATMTINVNLQAILWPTHKKPSIKADHTATRTRIMVTGHKAIMITMTLMGNLFSSGGSRCR